MDEINGKTKISADLVYSDGTIKSSKAGTISKIKRWANNQGIPTHCHGGVLEVYTANWCKSYHVSKYGRVGRMLSKTAL